MTLFFSIARLLLWPLQDVLINNLRNVMEIFSSSSVKFLLLQYIFLVFEAAKCRWGEERVLIQFYEFMTGTLNKRRWSWKKNLWMKFISWEIFNVRFFWRSWRRRWKIEIYTIMQINFYYQKHTKEGKYVFKKKPAKCHELKNKRMKKFQARLEYSSNVVSITAQLLNFIF